MNATLEDAAESARHELNRQEVVAYLRAGKTISAVRVSSAQARGAAKKYAYWGVAGYEVRLGRHGRIISRCVQRAPSARRSLRLAKEDARMVASETSAVLIRSIGELRTGDVAAVAEWIHRKEST